MNRLRHIALVAAVLAACGLSAAFAVRDGPEPSPVAEPAQLDALRAQGPAGLQTLLDRLPADGSRPDVELADAIDQVAGQKDAWASGLFWYTDLEEAKRAAQAQSKPILSLRLLGRLDEELSCANSRFFRVALYPNERISELLRQEFVLHWESVRPVPVVTIDFGDGRTLQRTLTGNSIHYVLSPAGEVLDALPGLYGPTTFYLQLVEAAQLAQTWQTPDEADSFVTVDASGRLYRRINDVARQAQLSPEGRDAAAEARLRRHHMEQIRQTQERLRQELLQVGFDVPGPAPLQLRDVQAGNAAAPDAVEAGRIPASKLALERPLLRQLAPQGILLAGQVDDNTWRAMADRHLDDARLGPAAREVFLSKLAPDVVADPAKVEQLIADFERSMALDTLINEYRLRPRIRQMLMNGQGRDLDALNERVYAEVFLTPSTDPWLGLDGDGVFTALAPSN